MEGVEVKFEALLSCALDAGEWSSKEPRTHCRSAGIDRVSEEKNNSPPGIEPRFSSP
jgi:hypothetical protein